jgi:hypothetical protein
LELERSERDRNRARRQAGSFDQRIARPTPTAAHDLQQARGGRVRNPTLGRHRTDISSCRSLRRAVSSQYTWSVISVTRACVCPTGKWRALYTLEAKSDFGVARDGELSVMQETVVRRAENPAIAPKALATARPVALVVDLHVTTSIATRHATASVLARAAALLLNVTLNRAVAHLLNVTLDPSVTRPRTAALLLNVTVGRAADHGSSSARV